METKLELPALNLLGAKDRAGRREVMPLGLDKELTGSRLAGMCPRMAIMSMPFVVGMGGLCHLEAKGRLILTLACQEIAETTMDVTCRTALRFLSRRRILGIAGPLASGHHER